MALPQTVNLIEVSPRDGLQNEQTNIATIVKLDFIQKLAESGLKVIESTSFVSPKWVPQMSDHSEVVRNMSRMPGVRYPALIPNAHGMELAIAAGVQEISVFTATTETFSKKNANCSLDESIVRISQVMDLAQQHNIPVRGYISCVVACPYEGLVAPFRTLEIAEKLIDLGCDQISLGDTIGVATPGHVKNLLDVVMSKIPPEKIAMHFHDTYGQALANIYV
ncbi:MAG: hydroxymethylglutaryl-CoA lyase, partial [Proteobacteria bacterium]|nr:hydroxymethylglutaryl-CoA lyase [Pseudomonadota bacterium]